MMKYVKLFEEFNAPTETVMVIHMWDPAKDTIPFNLLHIANVIQVRWDDKNIEETFNKYKKDIVGIILSGAPGSPVKDYSPTLPESIEDSGIPILGICYGMEYMMLKYGAEVVKMDMIEKTVTEIEIDTTAEIFKGLRSPIWAVMSHVWEVKNPPEGYEVIASGQRTKIAAVQNPDKKFWGLQFHPEKNWLDEVIFRNFLEIAKRYR